MPLKNLHDTERIQVKQILANSHEVPSLVVRMRWIVNIYIYNAIFLYLHEGSHKDRIIALHSRFSCGDISFCPNSPSLVSSAFLLSAASSLPKPLKSKELGISPPGRSLELPADSHHTEEKAKAGHQCSLPTRAPISAETLWLERSL